MDLFEHLGLSLGPTFEASYFGCRGPEKMFIQYHTYEKHLTWFVSTLHQIRSIDLWQWYVNITNTILDIINRPVFYLKLNSTL
jgi:hypothetical protein